MAHLADAGRRGAQEPVRFQVSKRRMLVLRDKEWLVPPVIVVAAVLLWEGLARAEVVSPLFFPAPSVIAHALWRLLVSGEMVAHLGASLQRVVVGFMLGAAPALVLGLAMGRWRRLRAALDPLIASAHPVPKIAILPIIMILFGLGEASKTLVVALGAFFPILINTVAGVRQISPIHFEVATNYGIGRYRMFTRVLLPGSLPLVLAGMRLGLNIALVLTIALEMRMPDRGLGAMIWRAWETFRTEELYATVIVIAALGIGFSVVVQSLTRRLVPWRLEREA